MTLPLEMEGKVTSSTRFLIAAVKKGDRPSDLVGATPVSRSAGMWVCTVYVGVYVGMYVGV